MKTRIRAALVPLALLSLLAGLAAPLLAQGKPVKIVYWRSLTGVAGDVQEELVKRFNESQAAVVVESQFQGAYAELIQKLLAGLAAGEVPDVVLLDSPFVNLFAKDGVLVSLDALVKADKSGFSLKDFIPGLLQDGYYEGKLYALPFMRSTPLLYANADMLAEAGLPRRVPATWDEFREFARKVTKYDKDGKPIQLGAGFTIGQTTAHWYFQGAVYSFGGRVSDEKFDIYLTEEPAVKAATLWQDMVFKDKTAMPSNTHNDLLNKKVAMVFGSTGSMGNLLGRTDFQVVAGFLPRQTRNQVPVGGSVLAVTSTDKARQAAAYQFLKFMTGADSIADIVIKTGYMPVSESSMKHPRLVEYFKANPGRAVAVDQLKYVVPQASVISLGKGTEIFRQMVEKLLIAGLDPKSVMQETSEALKAEYRENYR